MTSSNSEVKQDKIGRFKKSWLLFKGSLNALRMDKELAAIPLIGFAVSMAFFVLVGIFAFFGRSWIFVSTTLSSSTEGGLTSAGYIAWAIAIIIISGISMIFSGAIMHGALERFKGNDPTIRSSIRAALKRGGSLIGFGMFSTFIGLLISEIANRIPLLGGKIALWLAGSAWNVATFFAIPVIVTSDTSVNPIQATKKSVGVIKKAWGESLILSISIGLISAIGFIVYIAIFGGLIALIINNGANTGLISGAVSLAVIGYIALILIYTAVEAFAKAAIYHYATTGETPVHFDERMMRQAFSPKKARKIFGQS